MKPATIVLTRKLNVITDRELMLEEVRRLFPVEKYQREFVVTKIKVDNEGKEIYRSHLMGWIGVKNNPYAEWATNPNTHLIVDIYVNKRQL